MSSLIPRRTFVLAAGLSALGVSTRSLASDTYPSKLIKLVVPVPPGASTDNIARHVAQRLVPKLGQTVIVENRAGGAGGNVGSETVALSDPDGYTLLFAAPGPLAINKLLYPKLKYDPAQWVPVSLVATVHNVLVARPDSPFKSVPELIEYAKARPGKLNYATGGAGTTQHLAAELLKTQAGIDLMHVPYRGSAAATNGFLQGQVDVMFVELPATLQHIQAGKMRVLAVSSKQRATALPNVPTVAEALPGFVATIWYGIVAPPKTPPAIAEKVSAAVREIMKSPELVSVLQGLNITPVGSTPQELQRFAREEAQRWSTVIRSANISVE